MSNVEMQMEWATFLHSVNGFDKIYYDTLDVLRELEESRYLPIHVSSDRKFHTPDYLKKVLAISKRDDKVTAGSVVLLFLHTWHTQGIPNTIEPQLSSAIQGMYNQLKDLRDVSPVEVYRDSCRENVVRVCYNKLNKLRIGIKTKKGTILERGLGQTGIAKTLHLLVSEFFMMWDERIRETFIEENYPNDDKKKPGSRLYSDFMKRMGQFAFENSIDESFVESIESRLRKWVVTKSHMPPEHFLTIAKMIDEYNWVTITTEHPLPPVWYPGIKSDSKSTTI